MAVGGAAPSDASVRALSHRDAYPISFVTLRRLAVSRDRAVKPITAAFVKYVKGTRATTSFRQRGMLLAKADWPAVPVPRSGAALPPELVPSQS